MKAIHYLAVLCFFSLVSGHAIASSEPVDIPVRADSTFIYLIRHAESEENIAARERKKTGAPPLVGGALSHVKLSETGREQAARLGVQLKGATFVRYISSTAERAKSTLQICLDKMGLGAKITPEHMESLEEQSKGSREGRLVSETYGENNSNIADTGVISTALPTFPGILQISPSRQR
ncbi:MAG: histidine phosphatase family protein [Deltaproteobacteria bacterium]|nr:histidine phosphatase family protein [Deltaproteobacteria bacterium]